GRGSRSCRTLDEQLPETASRRENSRHDIQKMLQFLTEMWGINLYKLPFFAFATILKIISLNVQTWKRLTTV
ncbi:MAG: hypothetical protein MR911_03580, partial [Spirochaetia bacterium]|nr:hypothetical protein [Spirochaetia bacterium]